MAIPDSLARWREFMSKRAVEPERLSMKRLQALSPEAKEAYDQQRFAWIGADTVLETKDSSQIEKHLRIVQARGNAPSATAKRAFAISGRAGLGKSTTALNLGRKHERARRRTLGDGPDVTPRRLRRRPSRSHAQDAHASLRDVAGDAGSTALRRPDHHGSGGAGHD